MSSVKHSLCWCLQSAKGFYSWLMLMIYLKTFSNNPMTLDLCVYHVNHGKWWARIGVKSGSFKHREHITDSDFLCSPVEPCWFRAPDWLSMYSMDNEKVCLERGKSCDLYHICSFLPSHSILNLLNVISNRNSCWIYSRRTHISWILHNLLCI